MLTFVLLVAAAGQRLLLVKNGRPPDQLNDYALSVGKLLDERKPDVLVVEDRIDDPRSFSDGVEPGVWGSPTHQVDTARAYAKELAVACVQAHERSLKCASGPLTGELAQRMAWLSYLEAGQPDKACDFANRAFAFAGKPAAKTECVVKKATDIPTALAPEIARGKALLAVLKSAPTDLVSFEREGPDAAALKETEDFLSQATGKPALALNVRGSRARPSARPRSGRSGS